MEREESAERLTLFVNGLRLEVPVDGARGEAVGRIISGEIFADTAADRAKSPDDALDTALDEVLGVGASERITRGRRLDTFDRLTLAAYVCGAYLRRSAAINADGRGKIAHTNLQ